MALSSRTTHHALACGAKKITIKYLSLMAFETGAIRSCATVYVLTMLAMTLGVVVFGVSVALK